MSRSKAVFFDIDGTVFRYSTGIPEDTADAILKLRKNGHIPVLCTGRTKAMIPASFMLPGIEDLIAGAGTYIEMDRKVRLYYEMPAEETLEVIRLFRKYHFSPVVEGKDCLYVDYRDDSRGEAADAMIARYINTKDILCKDTDSCDQIHASKVSAVFTPESDPRAAEAAFKNRFDVINHRDRLLELVPKGYSKASGIEYFISERGIDRADTYAFGDSFNDLSMLNFVNRGVAMGNSDPGLFRFVRCRTQDYDKGGIANALKRFGLI